MIHRRKPTHTNLAGNPIHIHNILLLCSVCVFACVPVLSHTEFRNGNRTWNRDRSCVQWFAMCSRCNMCLYFIHIKLFASTLSFKTLKNGFNSSLFTNNQSRSMKTTSHNWKLLKFSFAIIIILRGAMRQSKRPTKQTSLPFESRKITDFTWSACNFKLHRVYSSCVVFTCGFFVRIAWAEFLCSPYILLTTHKQITFLFDILYRVHSLVRWFVCWFWAVTFAVRSHTQCVHTHHTRAM